MEINLKVFIALVMYVRPLLSFGQRYSLIEQAERENQALATSSAWQTFRLSTYALMAIYAGLSFYCGSKLKNELNPGAVSTALVIIWVTGPVFVFIEAIASSLIFANQSSIFTPQLYGALFGASFWAFAFSAYLLRSEVVKSTYRLPIGWPFKAKISS